MLKYSIGILYQRENNERIRQMKKLLSILLAVLMIMTLAGCSSKEETPAGDNNTAANHKIAVITDVGQLMDGGFNQGTYEGAKAYADSKGYAFDYYQPANGTDATDDDRINAMRQAIEGGAEVLVLPGFLQFNALDVVAAENPDVKFIFVDGFIIGKDNVAAITYHEEESGYFAGYGAVKEGYTKLGGTFGGAGTNPACNRFAYGYLQGANDAAKELGITVDARISYLYGGGYSASPELQSQISGWYNDGTQVVFACGGSMLQSVKAAANETADGMIIGVDTDQAAESDRILTSAMKGLAVSVQKVLAIWDEGNWDSIANTEQNLGAADDSTGLPTAEGSFRFKNWTLDEYNALFESVANGTVTVKAETPADCSTADAWATLTADLTSVNFTFEG